MTPAADMKTLAARATEAASLLKMLASEQRLLILCRLSDGEMSVGDLAQALGERQPTISQHLGRLRRGGLVQPRRDGTTVHYSLASDAARDLIETLCERFGK